MRRRRIWGRIKCGTKTKTAEALHKGAEIPQRDSGVFENAKQVLMWNKEKIVQNREGYAGQLNSFAKLIQYTTRELDAGIFEDEHLEKKLKTHLKKAGVKLLSSVFFVTEQGDMRSI